MADLSVKTSTTIDAPVDEVWSAVTTPALIKRWFFGVDTETDWKPGSPIVHRGEWQGRPYVDKGRIVRFEPPNLLVHTHWSDVSGTPDSPEHYQEVSWALVPRGGATELTITEHNIPSEDAKAMSETSWGTVLGNLKGLLERSSSSMGPLVVSEENPRYFTVASGDPAQRRAVYLTGSHIWNNLHDGMGPGPDCAETPEPFDYDLYLKFLEDHGHNFIRLWRWEQFRSRAAGGDFHLCMTPQPWARTGPGEATDGRPRFDLATFDDTFFERLRDRVVAARDRGIYVDVMLFEGWALHLSPEPENIEGHPFHAANNVNGIGITSILDYNVLPLDAGVRELQEAYIRKVIDTVHDLPNVLFEVANESSGGGTVDASFAEALGQSGTPDWGDSTEWQYWVIDRIRDHTEQMGYERHPVGMTMQFPVTDQTRVNAPMLDSDADWISPGYDDAIFADGGHPMSPGSPPSRWLEDPPANDGAKVVISDTDHYAPGGGDALWAWKSFLRGHHPILMDFGIIAGVNPPDPTAEPYASSEPARLAMGDTLRFAERTALLRMEPRADLTSTGYALANEGAEYLVLQPSGTADPFTVTVGAGSYAVEWFGIAGRETRTGGVVTADGSTEVSLHAPFDTPGPVVAHLTKRN